MLKRNESSTTKSDDRLNVYYVMPMLKWCFSLAIN